MNEVKDGIIELPPEPESTGVTPEQTESTPAAAAALVKAAKQSTVGGLGELSMAAVIERFPHGVTGSVAVGLLQFSTRRLESDLDDARDERDEARKNVEQWKDDCLASRQECAVLRARLSHAVEGQRLRKILITLGAIAVGIQFPSAWTGAGAALLLVGWFMPEPKESK